MRYVLVSILCCVSLFAPLLLATDTNCTLGGLDLSSLSGDWQTVGYETCIGCSSNVYLNLSICSALQDQTCGEGVSVCYLNIILESVTPKGVPAGSYSSESVEYFNDNKTMEITFDYHLQNHQGTTTIVLFCGKHLGIPIVTDSTIESFHMLIEWETNALCKSVDVIENKCYLVLYDYAYFQPYLYDFTPLIKTKGAYIITQNGDSTKYALNLCQEIVPDSGAVSLTGCEGAVLCRLSDTGNHQLILAGSTDGLQSVGGVISIIYSSTLTDQSQCNGDAILSIFFHCPYEFDVSPGPRLVVRDSVCYFHIDWYTEHACAQKYTKSEGCVIEGTTNNPFKFDLTPLGNLYSITGADYTYDIIICTDTGVDCGTGTAKVCQKKADNFAKSLGSDNGELYYADGELTLSYHRGDVCSSNYQRSSIFRFVCSQNSSLGPSFVEEDHCSYFFEWPTPLACISSTTQTGTCQDITYGQSRYDLSYLKRGEESNWVAGIGANLITEAKSRFILNLCGTLNSGGSDQSSAPHECVSYGVCEITETGDAYGIGKFNNVFARTGNVLVVEYTDGVCPTHSDKVARVNLVIICRIGVTDSSPVYVGMLEECFYEFQWEHTAACPTANHVTYGDECKVRDPSTLYTYNLSPLSDAVYSLVSNSYTYRLSICSALGDSVSSECTAAGACQTKGTTSHSLGGPNSTLTFANGSLQMSYEGGDTCSGGVKRMTLVSFTCDLNTTGIKEVEDPEVSHCSYFFIFYTDKACPFEYLFVDCSYTDTSGHTFDLSPLIRQFDNWNGTVTSGITSAFSSAKFYLNVCRPVTNIPGCHPLSSACMSIQVGEDMKWASIGKPKTGLKPLAGNVHNGLRILYTEDEPLDLAGVCDVTKPQTGITFLCPKSSETSKLDYPRLIGVDISGCIFEFEWYTKLACTETGTPVSTPCAFQDPVSGFVFSLLSLEGTTPVKYDENTNADSPFFYLSICSTIDSDLLQSSINPKSGAVLLYPNTVSDAKNSSLGEANSNLLYSDSELIQLRYIEGSACSSGKKSTLITFVCSHLIASSVSYISSLPSDDTCLFEFEYKTILACPPITTECVITSNDGQLYDLTRLKQLSGTGFPVYISGQYSDIPQLSSLRISICQPLEAGSTETCTNGSASCLSYDNHIFDLGHVTGDLQLSQQGELQLIYSGGTGCSKSALTVITFRCDRSVGVGQPLLSLHRNTSGSCYYDIVWDSEYACAVLPSEESNCAVTDTDSGFVYNFTSLSKLPDIHIQPDSTVTSDDYSFTISICRPITSSCGDGSAHAGACQYSDNTQHVTGLYSSTLILSDGEVQLVYSGGQACHSNNVNRTTIIRFYCDKTATSPRAVVLPELTHCLYEIMLYTNLACPPSQPTFKCNANNPDNGNTYDLSSLQHKAYFEVYSTDSIVYYFSVCNLLPSQYGNKGVHCVTGSSFCVLHKNSNNIWKATNLGTMTHSPYLLRDNLLLLSYSTEDAKYNTTVGLECSEESQSVTDPILVYHSADFSTNIFSWLTLAACQSEASDSCQVVQYSTGFTIDLDSFKAVSIQSQSNDVGDKLAISLCGALTDPSLGDCYSNNNTAVCYSKGSDHYPIATSNTSKWFYGDEIVVSYYNGFNCLDQSSPFKSSVELTLQCGDSESQSFVEPSNECVYQVLWQSPLLCQYQVECSVTHNGYDYDLNWLKAYDSNWRVSLSDKKFLINVCHNLLPEETQTCDSTAAICMISGNHAVNLGQVTNGPQYVSEGALQIEYKNGDECGDGTYSSTIQFNCQKGADLEDYITQSVNGCHYMFIWDTHVACEDAGGTIIGKCEIEDTVTGDVYDLKPIFDVGIINVTIEPLLQIIACQTIKRCGGAVCYDNSISYGKYTDSSLKLVNHVPTLEYKDGSPCGNSKYKSNIEFICNKSAIDHKYVEHLPIDGCIHYFLWHTPLACASTVTECKLTVDNRIVDITDLNRKFGAWEVDVKGDKLYFNPCAGMSSFLINTNLKSESCSSDSLACLLSKETLQEVGALDTAVLKLSIDGKYPIETARSQTKCILDKSKTKSIQILFYPGSAMIETPVFQGLHRTTSSCVISIVFSTSLVGESSPINEHNELITTETPGTCHNVLVKLNKNKDYHISSDLNGETLDFYVNFCSHTSVEGCKEGTVCLIRTQGSKKSDPIALSSYKKQRINAVNNSYIELIISSVNKSCPFTNKHILTVFYISCSSHYTAVSIEFEFTSPTGCLYVFNVLAPSSVCLSYEPTDAPPGESINSAGKTAVVFIVVLIVCLLGIFLAILITLCFYKRSTKGDRMFYKLRAYLSRVPDVQFRFQKVDGSEMGHLITNMSGSESEDETVSEIGPVGTRIEPAGLDKFSISDPPAGKEGGDGSEDEDFIKL
ncbi:Cation-independent mannose-6-phosphate receptor-like [Oopsacas minuta]|uniref:Cation-independent mannose-6-phosphate receptor-like n=1 Tax=Oopsacas minuta TaxID=111878 RepID=A0AAV7K2P3_9METZ|nr:Cation-independent mannose-6-phosphate receptor-like [Oopsacas minuta]